MMKKKLNNKVTAVLVMAVMLFFLGVTIFREKGKESYQENRRLAELPELKLSSLADGSYCKGLGEYITDQFAGRSYWISAKGAIDAEIGENIVNGVYIADNMLIDTSACEIDSADEIASEINDFASDYSGAVYFVAVPSSSGVYSDMLPEYLTYSTEKQQIDLLYSSLDSGIRTIDAYNILKMLNNNYIYYRNDPKWTSYGAYCVYRTVIQKLGFLPTAYDKYTIEHVTANFRGDLYNKTQYTKIKADMLDIYSCSDGEEIVSCIGYDSDGRSFEKELYEKSSIGTNDMYNLYLGEDVPLIKIKTTLNNEKKLLVIKDDYADCFIPFLIQHYSEIAIISPECLEEGMSTYVNKEDYAQTLFLFGISSFSDSEAFEVINK